MQRLLCLISITFLCSSAALAVAQKYDIVDLGTLGGSSSYVSAINNNGQVVGCAQDVYGQRRAVLFSSAGDGNNIDLGTLANSSGESWAYGINNFGQIVGSDYDQYGMQRAVFFDASGRGNNIALGDLGGGCSNAYAISDKGQVVGWAAMAPVDYYSNWHAVLFDITGRGNNVNLDKSQSYLSVARCITSNGIIAGNIESHAILFDASGQGANTDLGAMLTGDYSTIMAINEQGQMAGYGNTSPGNYHHAMLFGASGTAVDLGTLGGTRSYATSINSFGIIVGYSRTVDNVWHAAMFDATGNGGNIDLNTLIDPNLGWELQYAFINDKGQISGYGINPDGQIHAFLMTPQAEAKQITANVRITPETINLASHGNWVMATIRLAEGYQVKDIDRTSVTLVETLKTGQAVAADWVIVCKRGNVAIAKFSRNELKTLLYPGQLELTLTGKLVDGTIFTGTDMVKVIQKVALPEKVCKKK